MNSFHANMKEYRKQLEKGSIKAAYQELMVYFRELRSYFKQKFPDFSVSGSIYYGYMDMTYFHFFPKSLRDRKLKIVVLFIHDTFTFEVWLAGLNKQIQSQYLKLFSEGNWNKYHIASTTKGVDSIIDHILIDNPDFSDTTALTKEIERGTLKFLENVETYLSNK
ncbi:MAG: hypothetical protein JSV04_12335 [Candidatus Heimdallarchaeota archaeon]|nr:MAG: hypothetical protein JSV04_12335 [Candidatus Heimdallarchaeota archaeon]